MQHLKFNKCYCCIH